MTKNYDEPFVFSQMVTGWHNASCDFITNSKNKLKSTFRCELSEKPQREIAIILTRN